MPAPTSGIGAPQLLNAAATLANTATLLVADAVLVKNMFAQSGWGVYTAQSTGVRSPVFVPARESAQIFSAASNGLTQLYASAGGARPFNATTGMPDTIVSLDYKRDYRITDAPMEKGAFESYNKVQKPYSISLRMAKGGTETARQDFIDKVEGWAAKLALVDIITPEKSYTDCNIESFSLRRSAQDGAGLIVVDVHFMEIRETVFSEVTQIGAVNNGLGSGITNTVQAYAPGGSSSLIPAFQ